MWIHLHSLSLQCVPQIKNNRKFDLKTLRGELLNEHVKADDVRQFTDEDYNNLSEEQIKDRYAKKQTIKYILNAPCEWSKG
jgi:hypothetical protein